MKPLVETNAYLRDPAVRYWMLEHNALESSLFEGAFGLRGKRATPAAKSKGPGVHSKVRSRRSKAARKKSAKGS